MASLSSCKIVKKPSPPSPASGESVAPLPAPANLGFEEPSPGGGATAWKQNALEPDVYRLSLDGNVKKTGKYSAAIEQTEQGSQREGSADATAAWQQPYRADVFAGKTVVIRAWIKTEGATTCRTCDTRGMTQATAFEAGVRGAWLNFFAHTPHGSDKEGTTQATWLTPHVGGTSDWTLFEATATLPPNAEEAYLSANLWGPGKAWFDDVEIRVK